MNKRLWKMAFIFVFYSAVPVEAQDSRRLRDIYPNGVPGITRFQMFNECRPIPLQLNVVTFGDTESIENDIRRMVEGRLRSAGILRDFTVASEELFVYLVAILGEFTVRMEFHKLLYDPKTDITHTTPTHFYSHDGTYNEISDFLQPLSAAVDTFIDDYLYVNEGSC